MEQSREAARLQQERDEKQAELLQILESYERLKEKLDEKDALIEKLKGRLDEKDAAMEAEQMQAEEIQKKRQKNRNLLGLMCSKGPRRNKNRQKGDREAWKTRKMRVAPF